MFFFKQSTAYDMRISYWSSDVCSSDLERRVDLSVEPRGGPFDLDEAKDPVAAVGPPHVGRQRLLGAVAAVDLLSILEQGEGHVVGRQARRGHLAPGSVGPAVGPVPQEPFGGRDTILRAQVGEDRKSTRLNSSH